MNKLPEIILKKAIEAHGLRNFSKAKKLYKDIIKKEPKNAVANYNTGIIYRNNNKFLKSLKFFKIALEANPRRLQYWNTYIDILIKVELFADAKNIIKQAKKIGAKGKEFDILYKKLENAEFKKTQNIPVDEYLPLINLIEIENFYEALVQAKIKQKFYPRSSRLLNIIGNAHRGLKQFKHAIENLKKAIEIDENAQEFYIDLGHTYALTGNINLAITQFNKCIEIDPYNYTGHYNLGVLYNQNGDNEKAVIYLNKCLKIKPNYANAHNVLAYIYHDNREYIKAIKKWEDALLYNPNLEAVKVMKLFTHAQINDWDYTKKELHLLPEIGTAKEITNPVPLLSIIDDPISSKARAVLSGNGLVNEPMLLNKDFEIMPDKIRIAYFSTDFYGHPVSYLLAKVIETHNRQEFEVFGYSLETKSDEMRLRLEKAFDVFRDVASVSDKDIALMCVADKIDIIIDLNGFTQGARSNIFGYKPAPIQISYLGCPVTFGSKHIDYIISDEIVIPDEFSDYYTEKIIRLPHTYMPTDNTRNISNRKMKRSEFNLPENKFILCCFNNSHKITYAEFDIWLEVMSEVEGSVLWLKWWNKWSVLNLHKEAKKRGIEPSRIIFAKKMSMEEHLASYKMADLFVDTFAFNAHTTATEALWAGLPVVTLPGKGFASRVCASILTAIDLPELISNSKNHYKEIIIKLANNPNDLIKLKNKLENNRSQKPLFNSKLYTKNLERAFHLAYGRYFEGKKLNNITVYDKAKSIN